MDEVDFAIGEYIFETLVAPFHGKCVPDRIEGGFGPPTDRVHVGKRMALIDGDELRAEAETDDGDVDLALAHHAAPLLCSVYRLPSAELD